MTKQKIVMEIISPILWRICFNKTKHLKVSIYTYIIYFLILKKICGETNTYKMSINVVL